MPSIYLLDSAFYLKTSIIPMFVFLEWHRRLVRNGLLGVHEGIDCAEMVQFKIGPIMDSLVASSQSSVDFWISLLEPKWSSEDTVGPNKGRHI